MSEDFPSSVGSIPPGGFGLSFGENRLPRRNKDGEPISASDPRGSYIGTLGYRREYVGGEPALNTDMSASPSFQKLASEWVVQDPFLRQQLELIGNLLNGVEVMVFEPYRDLDDANDAIGNVKASTSDLPETISDLIVLADMYRSRGESARRQVESLEQQVVKNEAEIKDLNEKLRELLGVNIGLAAENATYKKERDESRSRVEEMQEELRLLRLRNEARKNIRPNVSWDPRGYYRALGITDPEEAKGITAEQIDKMFKAKSSFVHPDTPNGNNSRQQRLAQARDFLKNPLNRRSYGR